MDSVESPEAGSWTMRLRGVSVPSEWPYDLEALVPPGGISVSVSVEPVGVTVGQEVEITAFVSNPSDADATTTATITTPSGIVSSFPLTSNGAGTYTGAYSNTSECGVYQIALSASGEIDSTGYTRLARTVMQVSDPVSGFDCVTVDPPTFWGDANCSGGANPIDSLLTLRSTPA